MIDIQVRDLTLTPNDPKHLDWIVLTNDEWKRVEQFINQIKEPEQK